MIICINLKLFSITLNYYLSILLLYYSLFYVYHTSLTLLIAEMSYMHTFLAALIDM